MAQRLRELLNKEVRMLDDCVGEAVKSAIDSSQEEIILLENLRFHPEEETNEANFAKALAGLADIFVNDAFGTAHRAHASTEGVTHYLTSVSGFLLEKEIRYLGGALDKPKSRLWLFLGELRFRIKSG